MPLRILYCIEAFTVGLGSYPHFTSMGPAQSTPTLSNTGPDFSRSDGNWPSNCEHILPATQRQITLLRVMSCITLRAPMMANHCASDVMMRVGPARRSLHARS